MEAKALRPVTTGALPEDFVLHRAGKDNKEIISSKEIHEVQKDREVHDEPDFDVFVPLDDDFDIDIPLNDDFDLRS